MTELLIEASYIVMELLPLKAEQAEELFDADELLACDVFCWVDSTAFIALEQLSNFVYYFFTDFLHAIDGLLRRFRFFYHFSRVCRRRSLLEW